RSRVGDPGADGGRRARRLPHARLGHDRRPFVRRRDRGHGGREDRRQPLETRRRRVRGVWIESLGAQRRWRGRRGPGSAQSLSATVPEAIERRMPNQTMTVTPPARRGLIRILGVGFGLAVIVGSTIGIGVLRTPGLVAGQIPNRTAILVVWIVGGLYTLVGAACLAELGTMLPEAGGYYLYARRAFRDTV